MTMHTQRLLVPQPGLHTLTDHVVDLPFNAARKTTGAAEHQQAPSLIPATAAAAVVSRWFRVWRQQLRHMQQLVLQLLTAGGSPPQDA